MGMGLFVLCGRVGARRNGGIGGWQGCAGLVGIAVTMWFAVMWFTDGGGDFLFSLQCSVIAKALADDLAATRHGSTLIAGPRDDPRLS